MKYVEKDNWLGCFNEYGQKHPNHLFVAAVASQNLEDDKFLEDVDIITSDRDGIVHRNGWRSIIFCTEASEKDFRQVLSKVTKDDNNSNWQFVMTMPSKWPSMEKAITECEWRANKWQESKSKPRVVFLLNENET